MTSIVPLMFLVGLCLSAFFSGSETGFYRVARVRLALDARQGDLISKILLWLTNNPSLFVATTLIGNNVANYVLSLAIVLGTRLYFGGHMTAEIVSPILVSPVVFVYGELFPKNLFYLAPNRLLKLGGPIFLLCSVLFAPVSAVLWLLARLLQAIVGEAPEAVQLRLARNELRRLLQAGHEAGILLPSQQRMAQAVFDSARLTLPRRFPSQLPQVTQDATSAQVSLAVGGAKHGQALVFERGRQVPVGYVRYAELSRSSDWKEAIRELPRIWASESPLAAIVQLRDRDHTLGVVVDQQSRVLGIVEMDELVERVLGGA